MSFFQEKIFLTKKNIFRPGANALVLNKVLVGALLEKGNLFVVQSINAVFPVQKYSEKKKKKKKITPLAQSSR